MTLLWVIEFDYRSRLHHGAILRYLNYGRELTSAGHTVLLAAALEPATRNDALAWFKEIANQGCLSEFIELPLPNPSRLRSKLAALAGSPAAGAVLLRRWHARAAAPVADLVERRAVDAVLISNRRFLFLAPFLPAGRTVLDLGDSMALYYRRALGAALPGRDWRAIPGLCKDMVQNAILERHYVRRVPRTLVVSSVDRDALARLSGMPGRIAVIPNGVSTPAGDRGPKAPGRIIFSGNLDFPPNSEAAAWFASRVLPLVRERVPDAHFVIAGPNAPPSLLALAGEHVTLTGYVEDLGLEIARSSLFVAPLLTGGGFKNKVVEALANRTFVIGTPLATEFLPPHIRKLVPVASDAAGMAGAVVTYLNAPSKFAAPLAELFRYVAEDLSWRRRTEELLALLPSRGGPSLAGVPAGRHG